MYEMRSVLDQLREESMQAGIQAEMNKTRMENARTMLKANKLSMEDIALYTGLTVIDVKKLAEKLGSASDSLPQ